MKVLVTGGTGFLGQALLPALLDAGHQLRALVRSPTAAALIEGETAMGDVLDPLSLAVAMEGCEAVVHAAGTVSHSAEEADRTWRVHVQGTQAVIEAARVARVRRLIFLSSSGTVAVREAAGPPVDEEGGDVLPLIARWPYYRAKRFAEDLALSANGEGMEVLSLNPSLLLGPGEGPTGQSTWAVRVFLDGALPLVPGGTVSFVDVRDVADTIVAALERGRGGRRYLLASANLSWKEFYSRLARMTGLAEPTASVPVGIRKVLGWFPNLGADGGLGIGARLSREELELASHHWGANAARARAELGFRPRDPSETLMDTVEHLARGRWG